MSRKSLSIWILLLLIFAVLRTSATDNNGAMNPGNEDNEGSYLDDYVEEDDEDEDEDEGAGQQPVQSPVSLSYNDVFDQDFYEDYDLLMANIIGGAVFELTSAMIICLPPNYIFELLNNPEGARLAAALPFDIFTEPNREVLIASYVHDNFYSNVDFFSERVPLHQLSSIPASFIIKTIQVHSAEMKFNLSGFIENFENYDQNLVFGVSKVLCLPHLFNLPAMHTAEYYLGRGISFEASLPKKEQIIWDISLQLFLHRLLNDSDFRVSLDSNEILKIIKQEIISSRQQQLGQDINFNMNYFGIQDTLTVNVSEIFGSSILFTLKERPIDFGEFTSTLGLPNFFTIDYKTLEVENRIVYRLIIYLTVFNPTLIPEDVRNTLVINLINSSPLHDFTGAEFDFFTTACIENRLGDVISQIFQDAIDLPFRRSFETKLTSSTDYYDLVVSSITKASDKFFFLKCGDVFFRSAIKFKNEDFYRKKQANRPMHEQEHEEMSSSSFSSLSSAPPVRTKRSRNGDHVPESHFSSHFLSSEQIQSFGSCQTGEVIERTFVVPYPDRDHFNARFDNFMQNLESCDFGEIEWKKSLSKLPESVKEAYEQHERNLDEFVRLIFQTIDFMRSRPHAEVDISFRGSPSRGDGLKFEAFQIFAQAILLPRFKVFWYSSELNGFIPYPLLHPDIMSSLGFLNKWFLSNGLTVSWDLSEDYLKFLFYEEDPHESMQILIETFYRPIFRNIEGLTAPGINPLDYFTTIFHSHQPLAFHDQPLTATLPLDLFSPSTESSSFTSLFDYLSQEDIEFLSAPIFPPSIEFEESKIENFSISESKEDLPDSMEIFEAQRSQSIYLRQLELKTEIVDAIRHAASQEIIQNLLLGRFAFMRYFLPHFNAWSQNFITSELYFHLQRAQAREITAEILISGLSFSNERNDIQIFDEEGNVYTPRQALEFILRTLPPQMMKTFYWFCTGCLSLPLGDLSTRPIGVVIYQVAKLPASRTCFRSFTFNLNPAFNLRGHLEAMRRVLLEATGFHANEGANIEGADVGVFIDVATNQNENVDNDNVANVGDQNENVDNVANVEDQIGNVVGHIDNVMGQVGNAVGQGNNAIDPIFYYNLAPNIANQNPVLNPALGENDNANPDPGNAQVVTANENVGVGPVVPETGNPDVIDLTESNDEEF